MARAAYSSLPGVASLDISGTNATFTLKDGEAITEDQVRGFVAAEGLTFDKLVVEQRAKAASTWQLAITGLT